MSDVGNGAGPNPAGSGATQPLPGSSTGPSTVPLPGAGAAVPVPPPAETSRRRRRRGHDDQRVGTQVPSAPVDPAARWARGVPVNTPPPPRDPDIDLDLGFNDPAFDDGPGDRTPDPRSEAYERDDRSSRRRTPRRYEPLGNSGERFYTGLGSTAVRRLIFPLEGAARRVRYTFGGSGQVKDALNEALVDIEDGNEATLPRLRGKLTGPKMLTKASRALDDKIEQLEHDLDGADNRSDRNAPIRNTEAGWNFRGSETTVGELEDRLSNLRVLRDAVYDWGVESRRRRTATERAEQRRRMRDADPEGTRQREAEARRRERSRGRGSNGRRDSSRPGERQSGRPDNRSDRSRSARETAPDVDPVRATEDHFEQLLQQSSQGRLTPNRERAQAYYRRAWELYAENAPQEAIDRASIEALRCDPDRASIAGRVAESLDYAAEVRANGVEWQPATPMLRGNFQVHTVWDARRDQDPHQLVGTAVLADGDAQVRREVYAQLRDGLEQVVDRHMEQGTMSVGQNGVIYMGELRLNREDVVDLTSGLDRYTQNNLDDVAAVLEEFSHDLSLPDATRDALMRNAGALETVATSREL